MIRGATTSDLGKLHGLVMAMHQQSDFLARGIGVHEAAARNLIRDCMIRHGRTNEGGTLLNVVEVNGELRGFMLGSLQRVYLIGDRLEAVDVFLYCAPNAPARAAERLIDEYIAWATGNPKVADTILSFTYAGGIKAGKLARIYERKGFAKRGEIWKRAA